MTSVEGPVAGARKELIERYMQSLAEVPGWLDDLVVLQMIDEVQERLGLTGDVLEIGTYQGRTAILLAYLCRENETLAVCDVFEHGTGDPDTESERAELYMDLTRESFERHFLQYPPVLPEIHQCKSQDLGPRLRWRSFRLVHVDGSHQHIVARSDLRLAKQVTAAAGVVEIDDYRREHTPGVVAAAWEQVATGGLLPICPSPGKLYGCWRGAERYRDRLRQLAGADPALRTEEQLIRGHSVLRISDASVVGLSREEHLAVMLAELQREATPEAWRGDREAGAQALAALQAELVALQGERAAAQAQLEAVQVQRAAVQGELAESRAALQRQIEALEVWRCRLERAQQELEERAIELAKQGLRNDDLRLRVNLLESALASAGHRAAVR